MSTDLKGTRVCIDIDGVLADYCASVKAVAADMGIGVNKNTREPTSYDMQPWWDMDTFKKVHRQWQRDGAFITMPLMEPDAPAYVNSLHERGAFVIVATSRVPVPGVSLPDLKEGTRKWLDTNGFQYSNLIFTTAKASIDAHVYIDDNPSELRELTRRRPRQLRVVRDHLYNRTAHNPVLAALPRVSSLREFTDLVTS